ncbi:hypothetical protein M427DRAFT_134102 [Gonapodya prolifera JEL478]|uniref:CCHC-type domain-containing protein n=1 Tax=Gonapodya prolifera (strain JEL478) TaxID=1344416 RepID=A0A139AI79_GONPJ|nr:hypothetical protein M427DRAFT_134102 [Gonapodya prolifera JEL478]|eukprot:KXS16490.1 hypothetical protein M427DRAFT_134102 [Gonapodya prolifera JEL478]
MTALVENTAFLERLLSERSPQMPLSDRMPSSPSEQHLARILQVAGIESYGQAPASPPPPSSSTGQQTPPDSLKGAPAMYQNQQGSPFGLRFQHDQAGTDQMLQLEQQMAGLDIDQAEEEMAMRMQREEWMLREGQLRSFNNHTLRNLASPDGYTLLPPEAIARAQQMGIDIRTLSNLSNSRSSYPPAFAESDNDMDTGVMGSGHPQTFSRRSAFFHRDLPNVTPPEGYVCKLCFVPGHFMKHCSLYRERPRFEGFRKGYSGDVPPENYLCKLCFIPGHFMKNCSLYKERSPQYPTVQANNGPMYRKDGSMGTPPPGLYSPAIQRAAQLRAAGITMQNGVRKPFTTVPPDGYVCKICGVPGHWIQQCPIRHMQPAPAQHSNAMGNFGYGAGMQNQYDSQWERGY